MAARPGEASGTREGEWRKWPPSGDVIRWCGCQKRPGTGRVRACRPPSGPCGRQGPTHRLLRPDTPNSQRKAPREPPDAPRPARSPVGTAQAPRSGTPGAVDSHGPDPLGSAVHERPAGTAARPWSRRGESWPVGRKKKLFFESDSEAGWLGPRRPEAGEREMESVVQTRGTSGSGRTRRGRPWWGLVSRRSPRPCPFASRFTTSCPDFPDHSLGADWCHERLASGFFPLICPNSPWRRAGRGLRSSTRTVRLRERADFF